MFDEFYTEFWSKKEISYQHVHMFWSFWVTFIVCHFFHDIYIPALSGFMCGMCLEIYQYRKYILNLKFAKTWLDSLRDLCFWTIGGCLNYIIIFLR